MCDGYRLGPDYLPASREVGARTKDLNGDLSGHLPFGNSMAESLERSVYRVAMGFILRVRASLDLLDRL